MGKVIRPLAHGTVPAKTIFDRRFVAECCETFHLHWRNLRLELSHGNWRDLAAAIVEADRVWREHGSPAEHPHLELTRFLRRDEAVSGTSVGAELCENLYKTAPPPFGADAEFYDDDQYVHVHLRDLRIEMSVEDFVAFSGVMAAARERLLQDAAPTLARLFSRLDDANVIYAVARNWDNLPDRVELGPHSDLDLLVHPAHLSRVQELWGAEPTDPQRNPAQRRVVVAAADGSESFILVDLRAPGDGYYPEDFCQRALTRRVRHERGFWTLAPREHFLALAYHVVHHKGVLTGDYAERLTALARELGEPMLKDGSLFAQLVARVRDAGIAFEEPDDRFVLPRLPFVLPVESVLYSRVLCELQGVPIHSRIYVSDRNGGPAVAKQTTGVLAAREAEVLRRIDSPRVPRVLGVDRHQHHSVAWLELVDGVLLSDVDSVLAQLRPDRVERFLEECIALLADLQRAGIRHRDITPRNVLVRDGRPVLIDFGWAAAPGLAFPPELERDLAAWGLGERGRPPEGGYCDAYALGVALRPLLVHEPRFLHLVEALTAPVDQRVTDPVKLLQILHEGEPAPGALARALAAERADASTPATGGTVRHARRGVLCLADEVAADPTILTAAAAGARLIAIYAPDLAPADATALLTPAVKAAGWANDQAPEIVVYALARSLEHERQLAAKVDALATRRAVSAAFAGLPRLLPEESSASARPPSDGRPQQAA